jgi:hypothetical protein
MWKVEFELSGIPLFWIRKCGVLDLKYGLIKVDYW